MPSIAAALRLAGLMGCLLFTAPAQAQAWPVKPVRLIVPFTSGGSADMLGRLVAQKLAAGLKQSFIVENRPGAGGVIGSELVAKAAPDGYTLLVSGVASHCIAPALSKNFPFDPVRDFTHIALFGGPPGVLVVHPDLPARSLAEFIALARAQPGRLAYGSPGNGTQGHLLAELLKQTTGIDIAHVPYKGASPAVADLIAGHLRVASTTLSTASTQIHAGRARALAVSSSVRVPDFPDVPTFAEQGYAELVAYIWFSLSGPAGMPGDIVRALNGEVRRALQLADVRARLHPEGIEPGDLEPQAFAAFVAAEVKRWGPVVRASGAHVD
ncbi:MAG: tripartite tricarboxylate transporter substrate binding protein [Betaproteobacteria bacterium]|nr:tripartite tricarboxylate transporter substrate binding protein [Betaproteobacteria bacterium]